MRRALAAAILLGLAVPPLAAAPASIFQLQSQSAFLEGSFEGVSVDPLGTLRLADEARRLSGVEEPFVFTAARHPEGWVVGTGNSGRVLLVDERGEVRELFQAPEPQIFALWVDRDGTVFAGSSPDGKVYRIRGGSGEPYFEPGETYIWALAGGPDGSLLVGTGIHGRLYRVDRRGRGELFLETDDTHVRSLLVRSGGEVLVGTAGFGLILSVDSEGRSRTLYDAAHPEVVALAEGTAGVAYAAVLASEATLLGTPAPPQRASQRDQSEERQGQAGDGEGEEAEPRVTVTVGEAPPRVGTRPRGFRGPRSEVVRIDRDGRVEPLWSFDEETVYSLLWHRDRLWVGTGMEGGLYSFGDSRKMVLEQKVGERQIVALAADRPGPAFATTNAAAVYRLLGRSRREGVYISPVLDARQISRFGVLHWRGEAPTGTDIAFSFRSGMSREPDRTWSSWTPWRAGLQVSAEGLPGARYLQWRVRLRAADGASPQITGVEVSYRQHNLRPRITGLEVLEPGQVVVPATFNPAQQVFEPAHPTRDGIFTTLEPAREREDRRTRTLWKRGFRTLRWQTEDPNDDELVFRLEFRRDDCADCDWLPVVDDLEEEHFSFDATVLPDGVYRFRLTASDRADNLPGEALTDERVSEPVVVDHEPPRLLSAHRLGSRIQIVLEDELSPLREVVYSVDAGEWKAAEPEDGLLDGSRETLHIEPPREARLLLLRAMDAAFNVATFDLSEHLR